MALPEAVDVVVVGGGIVGVSAAYFLAKRGVPVALCEKGRIGGEQSGRNWGFVRVQGRDPAEVPMMLESQRIWRGLAQAIGADLGYREHGCLYLGRDRAELDKLAAWLEIARLHQLDTRVLTPRELGGVLAGGEDRFAGALFTSTDGRAEPALAAPVLAEAAAGLGAHVLSGCAVRGIEREAGRVSAVVTEHGPIRARHVVCAAGVWTSLFCRALGVTVPQLRVRASVARTAPAPRILDGAAWSHEVAIRRREDGGYSIANGFATEHWLGRDTLRHLRHFLPSYRQASGKVRLRLGAEPAGALAGAGAWSLDEVSPFEQTRVLDPAPSAKFLAAARAGLRRWFPEIADVPVVESWAGMIEAAPDELPMISGVEGLEGFTLASGFSGHGFGIGPGAGRVIADLATGRDPGLDLSPFRLARFFERPRRAPGVGP